ncbi:MAG: presenilin family intramembrane aspartyl protease PSH [Halanaeroarchaeum sp.]
MEQRARAVVAVVGAVAFFLVVQFGALALAEPFREAGYQSVEDPQNPANSALYVGVILVATVVMLALMRYGRTTILRGFLVLTSGLIAGYVFSVAVPAVVIDAFGGINLSAWVGGAAVSLGLLLYPEWWVIDASALLMGMGAAALFGISFGILPALLLLIALAVYDAISVYGTKHMLTLASGVMELRVPVLVIIPTTIDYSFIEDAESMAASVGSDGDDGSESDDTEETPGESGRPDDGTGADEATDEFDREAIFIGLGDAVMPSILVASASVFVETPTVLGVEMAPLGAIVGTTAGLLVLLWMVLKGRAHAGLPLLNGGAIAGYLVGALAAGIPLLAALGIEGWI